MDGCVILNPNAGSASDLAALRARFERAGLEVRTTVGPGDATALARARAEAGVPLVIAAGGDGTISEVAQGLVPVRANTRLGIVPLGTGNDLARLLDLPNDPSEALDLAVRGPDRAIDVVAVEPDDAPRTYSINVAAGGFSGQVDEVLTGEMKARWGPLAYVWSAAKVLPDLTGYETSLAYDTEPAERLEALNVIVANGRTCGGGWRVSPSSDLEDGLLDVVVVKWGSALDLARVAVRLANGDYLSADEVLHRRARVVRITSKPSMWFNVDGELVSKAAVTFRVVPRALRVVVGPGYRRS
jgi:diacylglycerol kinase (ATP)